MRRHPSAKGSTSCRPCGGTPSWDRHYNDVHRWRWRSPQTAWCASLMRHPRLRPALVVVCVRVLLGQCLCHHRSSEELDCEGDCNCTSGDHLFSSMVMKPDLSRERRWLFEADQRSVTRRDYCCNNTVMFHAGKPAMSIAFGFFIRRLG
jgi:hypothetical protein